MNNLKGSGGSLSFVGNSGSATETFAMLYEHYMPGIYKYIHFRTGNVHLAEDLTSAVFEKALTGFRGYKANRASFLTWIMTIARNMVIDHYRQQSRRKDIPIENAKDSLINNLSPEQEVVKREELQRLQVCLKRLSEKEQEIVACKFGSEMNNRQIAGLLSLSESNIGTILYRAVRKLRDCFREWENGKRR